MKFSEINTLEDMDKIIKISKWDLIELTEMFKRKGLYNGVWLGFGLVGLFVLIRNLI